MPSEDDLPRNPNSKLERIIDYFGRNLNAKSEYLSFIPVEVLDEETGEFRPVPGAARLPDMGDDRMLQKPNGIRYKIVNNKNNCTGIQYIQPDGKYAIYGEAVRLPNGEVYKGKSGKIIYQPNLDTLTSSDFSDFEDYVNIDDLDFDFE
jgi:hypothetical protein